MDDLNSIYCTDCETQSLNLECSADHEIITIKVSQFWVNDSLDNAVINGYPVVDMTDELIASDMSNQVAMFDGYPPTALIPYIKVWKASQ